MKKIYILYFYFQWNFFNVFVDCEEALGLLKELNDKLDYECIKDLKPALEKVITVLESNLFGALLGKTYLFDSLQIDQNIPKVNSVVLTKKILNFLFLQLGFRRTPRKHMTSFQRL